MRGTMRWRGWFMRGKASAVITQNVDNLHQASGVPEDRVIELHGNASYATCLPAGCGMSWRSCGRCSWTGARYRCAAGAASW